jgi:hypothetical protein
MHFEAIRAGHAVEYRIAVFIELQRHTSDRLLLDWSRIGKTSRHRSDQDKVKEWDES